MKHTARRRAVPAALGTGAEEAVGMEPGAAEATKKGMRALQSG
jgi:hypothetical protein